MLLGLSLMVAILQVMILLVSPIVVKGTKWRLLAERNGCASSNRLIKRPFCLGYGLILSFNALPPGYSVLFPRLVRVPTVISDEAGMFATRLI